MQLWGESLGKKGEGTTPVAALGPVDQHSQLQLYLDGAPQHFITVVREKFNCGKATAKAILDDAYTRLSLSPAHGITDAGIAKEREELHLADAVYCPNAMVAESLRAIGIAGHNSWGGSVEPFVGRRIRNREQ